jgi:hypothetical protein
MFGRIHAAYKECEVVTYSMNQISMKLLLIVFLGLACVGKIHAHGNHSVPCSGPHKDDPGCDVVPPPPDPISINSTSIDWLNEKIIISGQNFSASTTVSIGGLPATIGSQSVNQIEIPLDAAIAGIVKGNHNLVIDDLPSASSSAISLFVKAELINKDATGCPCGVVWATELAGLGWGTPGTNCFEIAGNPGDPVDFTGTILTNPVDPAVYPHYPIGAAFTAEPEESVCRLTRVTSPLDPEAVADLVKIRINREQQTSCREEMALNVCNSITPIP